MGVIWHKIWYDLWNNKIRTLLVVLSIAVGIFALGATFGMSAEMLPTMDASHQSTYPYHLNMYFTQPISRDTAIALKKIPGVEDIEPINTVGIRYKLHPNDPWRKGSLLMRDDFEAQKFDLLQLKGGEWPHSKGLGIERMHSPAYGIDIGDQVIFDVQGKERSFLITGKIRHPFVPPPFMYDLAYFFGDAEVMELFGIPQGEFMQLLVRIKPYSAGYAREVATAIKEQLTKQGINVSATLYQDPSKHWGRPFVQGTSVVTEVLAVISLLLSVVLVSNTLLAIITQQTNQIGILKAIGGSRKIIIQVYLVGVFFYGLLALIIALPLGILASYSAVHWFLSIYNIDYEGFRFSLQAVIFQTIAAITVPLVAALPPVLQGAAITVRQAITSYGLGGDYKSNRLDRAVERLGQRYLTSYYAIALTNTFRRKRRLILSQAVLVIAGAMFLMIMSLSSSMKATLDAEFSRRSHDLIVYFEREQRIERTAKLAQSVPGVEKADMWYVLPVTIIQQGQKAKDAGIGSQIQGVPLDDPMYTPLIVEGRWFQPNDQRVVVMNKDTADDEHIQVGDVITLDMGSYGQEQWEVIGLYRVFLFFGGGFSIDAIYAPRDAVYDVTDTIQKADTLLVRTQDHSFGGVRDIANRLADLYNGRNMDVIQTETIPENRKVSDTAFLMTIYMLLVLAVIVALVGGIGLMGSLSISVIERTKEIGVMRAVGARSGIITNMYLLEGLLQGLMSWAIAVPLSMLLGPLLSNALGQAMFQASLDFRYNFGAVLTWLLAVLVIASQAAILPAHNATRVNVGQSLKYE